MRRDNTLSITISTRYVDLAGEDGGPDHVYNWVTIGTPEDLRALADGADGVTLARIADSITEAARDLLRTRPVLRVTVDGIDREGITRAGGVEEWTGEELARLAENAITHGDLEGVADAMLPLACTLAGGVEEGWLRPKRPCEMCGGSGELDDGSGGRYQCYICDGKDEPGWRVQVLMEDERRHLTERYFDTEAGARENAMWASRDGRSRIVRDPEGVAAHRYLRGERANG